MIVNTVTFVSHIPVQELLSRNVLCISLGPEIHTRFNEITLWHTKWEGVRISSQMHDVAERLEVGVLHFEKISTLDSHAKVFDFDPQLRPHHGVTMIIREAGISLESGVKLFFQNGQELLVLPADFPCALAVSGSCLPGINSTPEYKVEDYEPVALFSDSLH